MGLISLRTDNELVNNERVVKNKEVVQDSEELVCMTKVLYHEGRGEGDKGLQLIAQTIINRTKDERFPDNVCSVVKQQGAFFVTSKKMNKKIPSWWYRHIKKIAQNAIEGHYEGTTKARFFKRCDVENDFFNTRKFELKHKQHCFYR